MKFEKTVGHEKQKRLFLNILETGRLAHAYAFIGQEGIGKTAFALDLASLLGADPVLDLFVLDSQDSISAEETRTLRTKLALTPAGKCKVAVIKADLLTEEAASSLLKILEEPPQHSYIFLTTTNFYSLLPTIASRVQKVIFARALDAEIRSVFENEEIVTLASGRIGFAKLLAADENLLQFTRDCELNYQTLEQSKLADRFIVSEKIASLETRQILFFLQYCLSRITNRFEFNFSALARKLSAAFDDLQSNVNKKLSMDNLFLPQ